MNFEELEEVYEALAVTIDQVGEQREAHFLTRLVLLLANDLADRRRVLTHIVEARGTGIPDDATFVVGHRDRQNERR